MTDRRLSPTAANAQAKKAAKNRFKLIRLGERADSPHVFAGRIASLLKQASHDCPDEFSEAYADWVLSQFSARCNELQKGGQR